MNLRSFFIPNLFRCSYGLLLGLSGMLIFQSCKKEKEIEPEFPATLYLSQIKKKDGIRLFIGQKEIFDKELLRNFIRNAEAFGVQDTIFDGNETMVFPGKDSAAIKGLFPVLTVKTSHDTIFFESIYQNQVSYEESRVIFPMSRSRNPLGNSWPDGSYSVKLRLVGYGDFSNLSLSAFNFKIVKTDKYTYMDGVYRSMNWGRTFNEFDPTYVNTVRDTDTLAIEEFSYVFKKR